MARKRSRQSCIVYYYNGHSQRHLSTVPPSQTDPEDPSGQVRGKRRVHEQGSAEGDQRTSRRRHDFRATAVCRGKSHRSKFAIFNFFKLQVFFFCSLTLKNIRSNFDCQRINIIKVLHPHDKNVITNTDIPN